ncbi:hypothetical protein PF010_g31018, partial [Phytophthora fragariae]
ITRYDLPVNQAQEIDRAENVSDQPDEEGADEPRSLPSRRMEAEHEALDIFRYEVLREVQVLF